MRITYLHQYYNSPNMSGGTRSYEMAKRLVQEGHEVNLITSWREDDGHNKIKQTIEDGINIFWLPVPYSNHMSYKKRIASFFKFAYMAYRQSIKLPSDIVFASSTPLTIALPGVYAAKKLKVPFVFEVRDLWPELPIAIGAIKTPFLKKMSRRLEKFAYKNSDAIIALTEGMKEGVMRAGYPADKITVIPNAADLEKFYPNSDGKKEVRKSFGIPAETIVVLYPGTFGKINNVGYLVRLAHKFKNDPRVFFLTVGEGQEFESVKNMAVELGCLDHNFKMIKKVPKVEVTKIFQAADIVISTVIPLKELDANCANKFFDGLAAGCCVVINHGGWQADLLEKENCGFSLSKDIEEATVQLRDWLSDKELISACGLRARKVAENRFDRNILGKQLEQLLTEVIKNRPGAKLIKFNQ